MARELSRQQMTKEVVGRRNLTTAERRQKNRRAELRLAKKQFDLIDALRMQARVRSAANATMRVEPSDPKKMLEWKAADMIEAMMHK